VKPWVNKTFFLDLAIAPDGAVGRISTNINRRSKRAFGVLKTANEFVGVVVEREFEVWEKQKRAIHARGRVVPRDRGSRVEVTLAVPRRTQFLIGIFFVLYVLVSLGIATQPPDPSVSVGELIVSIAGAGALIALFIASARSQQADLRAFFERVFGDVARI
jgi:hypothetical protein